MILFHTVPYVRRKEHFTTGDKYGAWVAHQDIVRSVLQHSSVEGVHFFLPFKAHSRDELLPGLEELRQDFPHHQIEFKRLIELHDLARQHRYVFADDFEAFTTLALARKTGGECLFPLSTIVHTIPHYTGLVNYLDVLMLSEPFDTIITTSEAGNRTIKAIFEDVSDFIASRLMIDSPPKINITKIPLAVDAHFLQARDSRAARVELGLPADATLILYLGRVSEDFKADLEPLLITFRRLHSENPNLHLLIAGQDESGRYSSALRSLAERLGVNDRMSLIVNFPYTQKPLLYSAADIFVSPVDNIQETFGLSILEAMACELPVVASDFSGYRDLIAHGETGFLARTIWNNEAAQWAERVAPFQIKTGQYLAQQTVVDMEEMYGYLKLLADNEGLRRQFGSKGREIVVSKFNWRQVIRQYEELWKEQWQQLERRDRKMTSRLPLNYNRQFGHFAATSLNSATVLRHSPHRDFTADLQHIDESRLPYPVKIQELQRVFSELQLRPRSVAELAAVGNEATANAITWLWKKGFLEETGTPLNGGS
jgi:glycosyltransferase involved in cell wall biosynthesis